eukprot:5134350-Alexandrium_andersonii.AAC.1
MQIQLTSTSAAEIHLKCTPNLNKLSLARACLSCFRYKEVGKDNDVRQRRQQFWVSRSKGRGQDAPEGGERANVNWKC